MDPSMANLLKWSIENTPVSSNRSTIPNGNSRSTTNGTTDAHEPTTAHTHSPSTAALSALLGGPSDTELMKAAVASIHDPSTPLATKLVAFDNLEQLVEGIDNASNLAPLGLWPPLLDLLVAPESELRRMAAWCVGTAVQNNVAAQARALDGGAVGLLLGLAVGKKEGSGEDGETGRDGDAAVRRKACYALSSLMRNFQPGVEEVLRKLPEELRIEEKVDAGNMEQVDGIMERIRGSDI